MVHSALRQATGATVQVMRFEAVFSISRTVFKYLPVPVGPADSGSYVCAPASKPAKK